MIYYLCPDETRPSWGVGMLYSHLRLLNEAGYPAKAVHRDPTFGLPWLSTDVSVASHADLQAGPTDILVVPEIMVQDSLVASFPGRKLVFVQGAFLIHKGLQGTSSYRSLGFHQAMVVLPHIKPIVEDYYGLKATVIPPHLADYFRPPTPSLTRRKTILTVPKPGYETVGYYDHLIVKDRLQKLLASDWSFKELSGLGHREVAEEMQKAAFLISVNCLEAFNTTVPEAMATGCIPICYQGFGGRDFLKDQENAFVFPNNDVYNLLGKTLQLTTEPLDRYDAMRKVAPKIRESFSQEKTSRELLAFMDSLVNT